MVLLKDVLDLALLHKEITDGYVTERRHPEFGELVIYNYSKKCQFENHWNDVTMVTRGLIANMVTGEVVARGFPKFFNYGDPLVGDIDLDAEPFGVLDKLDGSLGVQYTLPDGRVGIATRGSFESEQALWATDWLRNCDMPNPAPEGATQLWEIIYPENRVVLDYGDRAECVLLGWIELDTGAYDYPVHDPRWSPWPVAIPDKFNVDTVRDALSLPDRVNAEGVVIWLSDTRPVKVKQEDYVALHRIVSNLTEKEVWRQLRAGSFREFVEALPDEFHEWARRTAGELQDACSEHFMRLNRLHWELLEQRLPDRKSQALWITSQVPVEYRGFLFALLDGRFVSDGLWKLVEPKGGNADK